MHDNIVSFDISCHKLTDASHARVSPIAGKNIMYDVYFDTYNIIGVHMSQSRIVQQRSNLHECIRHCRCLSSLSALTYYSIRCNVTDYLVHWLLSGISYMVFILMY